jgi:hypothetical protein
MSKVYKIHFNNLPEEARKKLDSSIHPKTMHAAFKKGQAIASPVLSAPDRPLLKL